MIKKTLRLDNEELINAGIMVGGDGLKASKFGKRIAFDGASRTVTDGPFAETREWIAGFAIVECASMAEALEIAGRNPAAYHGRVEIRPVHSSTLDD